MFEVLIVLSLTIILFIWGKFPPDVVALMSMLALFLLGTLTLSETLSGFSNPTVIMIAALFIIGEGLSRTGWTALAGQKFVSLAKNSVSKLLVIVTLGSSILSGLAWDYKFLDYVKVGAPLLLLFFITTMLLVPLI